MRSEPISPPRQIPTAPSIRSEQPRQMTTGQSCAGNGPALEDLDPFTKSEMTSSRTTETAHGNSWLPTCRCREPAYPMCHIVLARGRCAPPSNPRLPAAVPGLRAEGAAPRSLRRCTDA